MSKFLKGFNRDTDPIDQPSGSWRYARNMVIPPNSGGVQAEHGNKMMAFLPTSFHLIGTIVLQDETVVCFLVKPDTLNPVTAIGESEIGKFDPVTNTYTKIINDQLCNLKNKLNFKHTHSIQGEYKIDATGNVAIYWCDDHISMRFLRLYSLPANVGGNLTAVFDKETINIFSLITAAPEPTLEKFTGGVLVTGAYALVCASVNEDGTTTNYINIFPFVL